MTGVKVMRRHMKWIVPAIVVTTFSFLNVAFAGNPAAGAKIFKKKCKTCHRLSDGTKVGPGLAGVTSRRTNEWLHKWLTNPKAMIKKGDPIAVKLKKKYKKQMRTYKLMQDEENRENIIAFLKQNDENYEKQK
ncbi:MAG TPA: c-type cytochrome [Nitrospirae bacterium]|nr:c-type cytochrome [Nitrospirota bacterium]